MRRANGNLKNPLLLNNKYFYVNGIYGGVFACFMK